MTVRNKTQYNVSKILDEGTFQTISEVAHMRYETGIWREYADLDRVQRSRSWNSIVKENNVAVMATLLDVNSAKPLTSLGGYSKYGGDIPKIGIASKIEEQDILNIQEMKAFGDDLSEDDAKELIYTPLETLYEGIHSKLDFFCLQGASTGNIVVDVTNQVNGKYIAVDLNVPAANKRSAGTAWSDPAAEPVQQLIAEQEYAEDTLDLNLSDFHWEMSKQTYKTFITHPKVIEFAKNRVQAVNTDYIMTKSQIRAVLSDFGLAPIVIVDKKCKFDSDGKKVEIQPWENDNVVLITNTPWFDMKRAKSALSSVDDPSAMISEVEEVIVAASTWDVETITNKISAEAWMFPVPKDPKKILIFDIA